MAFSSFVFAPERRITSFTIASSELVSTVRSVVILMPSAGAGPAAAATSGRTRNASRLRMASFSLFCLGYRGRGSALPGTELPVGLYNCHSMGKPRRPASLGRLARPQTLLSRTEQVLREAIAKGQFGGNKLPAAAEIAEQLGVSRETVRLAQESLQRE